MGAVDYVPVPVVPEVLRAKVKIFAELFRKTRELEQLNSKLERHVAERTAELESSNTRLTAERAGQEPGARRRPNGLMGLGHRHRRVDGGTRASTVFSASSRKTSRSARQNIRALIHPDDWLSLQRSPRHGGRRAHATDRVSRAASATAKYAGASARRRRASTARASGAVSAASPSTSPIAKRPRSARSCWRARSTIARATRSP